MRTSLRKIIGLLALAVICVGSAAESRLTVLLTSDIHSRFTIENITRLGGIIHAVREEAGRDNVLLIDCGDLAQGDFSEAMSEGMLAIDFINAMAYDAWIPGNHEFDFGIGRLFRQRQAFRGVTLAANISVEAPEEAFIPWKIFKRGGMTTAVIGMTFPHLKRRPLRNETPFKLEAMLPALDRIMGEVMAANPDFIILAAHYSVNMSYADERNSIFAIASRYPQIGLILGGHTHQIEPGRKVGASSWFVEPGKHCEGIARIDIGMDSGTRKLSGLTSRFIREAPPGNGYTCPPTLAARLREIELAGNEAIAYSRDRIASDISGNPLQKLFGEAFVAASGADVAMVSPPRPQVVFEGVIRRRDLFEACPYNDTVVVLELSPGELKSLGAEQLWGSRQRHFRQHPFGFRVEKAAGKNTRLVTASPKSSYRCAINRYIVENSASWFPELHAIVSVRPWHDTGISVRDALGGYLKSRMPPKKN